MIEGEIQAMEIARTSPAVLGDRARATRSQAAKLQNFAKTCLSEATASRAVRRLVMDNASQLVAPILSEEKDLQSCLIIAHMFAMFMVRNIIGTFMTTSAWTGDAIEKMFDWGRQGFGLYVLVFGTVQRTCSHIFLQ